MKFIAAIIVAIIGGIIFWSRPFGRVRDFLLLMFNSISEQPVDRGHYDRRMYACRKCPVFYRPLMTCGTPFRNRDLGCWCFTPKKNKLKLATCWLRTHEQHRSGYGWEDGL